MEYNKRSCTNDSLSLAHFQKNESGLIKSPAYLCVCVCVGVCLPICVSVFPPLISFETISGFS
jgi:hypothetical protein